ncbi:MAG: hypothetical protein GY854_29695 [Deltaproteobacteria bacterium]|nr:hypothetical protein [Deltaproteobacteria bacterium]
MRATTIFWLLPVCLSCSISEEDRCGEGYTFEDGNCFVEVESDTDSDTNPQNPKDSGMDDGGAGITGLGIPCNNQSECDQYQADYCMLDPTNPTTEGSCTVKDCTTQPDDCPPSYICCDFPPLGDTFYKGHNICLPEAEIQAVIDVLGSCDG